MVIAPFDDDDVFAPFAHQVTHVVIITSRVLHKNFLAWSFGSVYADIENVVTYNCDIN